MDSLEKAVELVAAWPSSQKKQREQMVAGVDALLGACDDAKKIWENYARSPGAPDNPSALLNWVGSDRARALFDIHLKARRIAQRTCDLAGPAAGRLSGLDDEVIEMAYRQLRDGETGAAAAATALARLKARMDYLNGIKRRLASAPSDKDRKPARLVAKKTSASKKPKIKKSLGKQMPKKKPAAKKRAKKKK